MAFKLNKGGVQVDKQAKIYVAGHRGLVGSALCRLLQQQGYENLLLRTSSELNLQRQEAVETFFHEERPEYVFLAAARVGGIWANKTRPAEFIYQNVMIEANVIDAAYQAGVKKLMFLGSSCIYPKLAPQPLKEEYLMTGELEPTNQAYALAKIAGIEMCNSYNLQYGTNYISVMPTNLYGINDNFDLESSHVLPALIRKFHEAKVAGTNQVVVWGSGCPIREFLHVDDLAQACVFLMETYSSNEIVNIGCGTGVTIRELAEIVKEVVGFHGEIVFDTSKPDGTPVKLLDISRIETLGWTPKIALRDGIAATYQWYINQL